MNPVHFFSEAGSAALSEAEKAIGVRRIGRIRRVKKLDKSEIIGLLEHMWPRKL